MTFSIQIVAMLFIAQLYKIKKLKKIAYQIDSSGKGSLVRK